MATTQNLGVQETSNELQRQNLLEQKEQRESQGVFQDKQLLEQKEQRLVQERQLELTERQLAESVKSNNDRAKDRKQQSYASAAQQLTNRFEVEMQSYRLKSRSETPDPNLVAPTAPRHEDIVELSNVIESFINS